MCYNVSGAESASSDNSFISNTTRRYAHALRRLSRRLGVGVPSASDIKAHRRSWHASPPSEDNNDNMTTLTAKDKAAVKAFWAKVSGKADEIGTGALAR